MTRILVTGAGGLLGPYLVEAAKAMGNVTAPTRADCDLSDNAALAGLLERVVPDCVLHAAAYADVDGCEADPARAERDNALSSVLLSKMLPEAVRVIYLSTDQVYPNLPGPHSEEATAPVNNYGRGKLAGEQPVAARKLGTVLRINFFGPSRTPGRKSLSDFVIDNLVGRQPVTLFDDVFFSPLHMATLSRLIVKIATMPVYGVYNLGGRNGMSKAEFGLHIIRLLGLDEGLAKIGASSDKPQRAMRPLDLRMDVSRIERALGESMPDVASEILRLQRR